MVSDEHTSPPGEGQPAPEPTAPEPKKEQKKMAKKSKGKKAPKKQSKKTASSGPRGAKTLKVKSMLERTSGCTRAQVLEATGWKAVSMQQMAKACGLKLSQEKGTEKGKKVTTYFGK